jgi:hypothetical protein
MKVFSLMIILCMIFSLTANMSLVSAVNTDESDNSTNSLVEEEDNNSAENITKNDDGEIIDENIDTQDNESNVNASEDVEENEETSTKDIQEQEENDVSENNDQKDTKETEVTDDSDKNEGISVASEEVTDEKDDKEENVDDGIDIIFDETDSSKVTVKMSGTIKWDAISDKLDKKVKEENVSVKKVKFVGEKDAEIEFTTTNSKLKLSFDYAMTFDNLKLSVNGQKDVWLFANGHNFKTTDSVTTSGNIKVFGGGNEISVESGGTNVQIYGGHFKEVVGGSYYSFTESEGKDFEYAKVSVRGDTTVIIGEKATAISVVGGCLGGVNYGNISITYYASENDTNDVIIGSSADPILEDKTNYGIEKNLAKVINNGGSISIDVKGIEGKNTKVGMLFGVAESNVDLGSGTVNINVDKGVTYQGLYGAYGGGTSTVVQNANVYPSRKYATYEIGQILYYECKANFDININGNCSSGLMVQGCLAYDIIGDIDMVVNGDAYRVIGGGSCCGNVIGDINLTVNGTVSDRLISSRM